MAWSQGVFIPDVVREQARREEPTVIAPVAQGRLPISEPAPSLGVPSLTQGTAMPRWQTNAIERALRFGDHHWQNHLPPESAVPMGVISNTMPFSDFDRGGRLVNPGDGPGSDDMSVAVLSHQSANSQVHGRRDVLEGLFTAPVPRPDVIVAPVAYRPWLRDSRFEESAPPPGLKPRSRD